MGELNEKVDSLFKWAAENKLQTDPGRVSKLYDEARRRWGNLMPRKDISDIVDETLRKME